MILTGWNNCFHRRSCEKKFYTKRGYILTLHFIHLMAGLDDSSFLEVRDGPDSTSRLLKTIPINNFTRPESIVTTGNNMFITFSAKKKVKTELFLEITAGLEKAVDLNVTDSLVSDNNGRGVWVEKMRSNLHIHQSRVYRNNHVAGVHVDRGAGNVNITHSDISFNYADGVNITYGGAARTSPGPLYRTTSARVSPSGSTRPPSTLRSGRSSSSPTPTSLLITTSEFWLATSVVRPL